MTAQVEENALHCLQAKVVEHFRQLVVDRLDQGDAVGERRQSATGNGERLRIAIKTNQRRLWAGAQQGLGMTAEP